LAYTLAKRPFRGIDILLLREGRLAEHWDAVDSSEFFIAVGAVLAQAGTAAAQRS